MKKLTRSSDDRIVAGVCAGIAKYFSQSREEADMDTASLYEIDPTWIRLGWAILTLFSMGIGVIAYLLMWLIVPEE